MLSVPVARSVTRRFIADHRTVYSVHGGALKLCILPDHGTARLAQETAVEPEETALGVMGFGGSGPGDLPGSGKVKRHDRSLATHVRADGLRRCVRLGA